MSTDGDDIMECGRWTTRGQTWKQGSDEVLNEELSNFVLSSYRDVERAEVNSSFRLGRFQEVCKIVDRSLALEGLLRFRWGTILHGSSQTQYDVHGSHATSNANAVETRATATKTRRVREACILWGRIQSEGNMGSMSLVMNHESIASFFHILSTNIEFSISVSSTIRPWAPNFCPERTPSSPLFSLPVLSRPPQLHPILFWPCDDCAIPSSLPPLRIAISSSSSTTLYPGRHEERPLGESMGRGPFWIRGGD
eukprot:747003-Hanusia_phi.AAC.2